MRCVLGDIFWLLYLVEFYGQDYGPQVQSEAVGAAVAVIGLLWSSALKVSVHDSVNVMKKEKFDFWRPISSSYLLLI